MKARNYTRGSDSAATNMVGRCVYRKGSYRKDVSCISAMHSNILEDARYLVNAPHPTQPRVGQIFIISGRHGNLELDNFRANSEL